MFDLSDIQHALTLAIAFITSNINFALGTVILVLQVYVLALKARKMRREDRSYKPRKKHKKKSRKK